MNCNINSVELIKQPVLISHQTLNEKNQWRKMCMYYTKQFTQYSHTHTHHVYVYCICLRMSSQTHLKTRPFGNLCCNVSYCNNNTYTYCWYILFSCWFLVMWWSFIHTHTLKTHASESKTRRCFWYTCNDDRYIQKNVAETWGEKWKWLLCHRRLWNTMKE